MTSGLLLTIIGLCTPDPPLPLGMRPGFCFSGFERWSSRAFKPAFGLFLGIYPLVPALMDEHAGEFSAVLEQA